MKKLISIAVVIIIIALAVFMLSKEKEAPVTTGDSSAQVAQTQAPESIVAIQGVTENIGIAAVAGVRSKTVSWEAQNFPAGTGVDINLLRKVSDSPVSYVLVRKIVSNTNNDGSEIWTPAANENGSDLYLEVTCASGGSFSGGCQVTGQPIKAN